MEVDDIDFQDSATQPPSRDEHPWLAERTPKRLDAEQAHQPLDPAFVLSFRHAISNEAARDTVYLDDATEALMAAHSSNMDIFYPLTLTPALPQLPPEITPEQLLEAFRTNVHPHMPLVCQIPVQTFGKTQLSGYLSYAMAALGALTLPLDLSVTLTLWSTARTLITAGLEVDNREARKPSLINAWALLATYGALCADETTWKQMNISHGYVGTAARRLYHSTNTESHCNAIHALLLADVLRSVHYGHPLAVHTLECLAGPGSSQSPGLRIYEAIVLQGRVPPTDAVKDGPLIALVAILADIHTFSQFFYPLGLRQGPNSRSDLSPMSSDPIEFHNPFLPLSADNESRLTLRKLRKGLDLWAAAYKSSSSADEMVLYYLCKMYLSLPTLQSLPMLAEYAPRVTRDGLIPEDHREMFDDNLKNALEAQDYAWQIVDLVDQKLNLAAPWLPIAVFYASLVVWRASVLKLGGAGQGSRKILLLFREELDRMQWPCCRVMVSTLDNIRA